MKAYRKRKNFNSRMASQEMWQYQLGFDGKDRATGTIKNTSYEMSGLFGCRVGLSQEGTKR